ncbi:hypothetical protein D623_10024738 [Myotis brandtii]|uniref:Uncharacterized protein n=1 Tax=Myotis brandtii TaxID=109478 RepID=S7Q2A2_MYOBR|nr:hypothetical protein D623_10024738 [Myotis brandtii]
MLPPRTLPSTQSPLIPSPVFSPDFPHDCDTSNVAHVPRLLPPHSQSYLRFMSPFKARLKMLDRFPPGEQPQIRMASASILFNRKSLPRAKAVRGMMPYCATTAMASPLGFQK